MADRPRDAFRGSVDPESSPGEFEAYFERNRGYPNGSFQLALGDAVVNIIKRLDKLQRTLEESQKDY